jgi:hypothetical protein
LVEGCNVEAGIVEEGVGLEPLPWEAKGLNGLELPIMVRCHWQIMAEVFQVFGARNDVAA